MKVLFYDTKPYDRDSFERVGAEYPDVTIDYLETDLNPQTATLAEGYDAVCVFVNSDVGMASVRSLWRCGVRLILLRCAGFNNVDLSAAEDCGITVLRVPGYSPQAVAEHAMALALAVNRHLHKAYIKVRENNFSLNGLTGSNLYGKTAGIIGTGRIGAAMARICQGFGMQILAYDVVKNSSLSFAKYVGLDELLQTSDLISLHCPLREETRHLINLHTIRKMKPGVILINTSRGGLVATEDLIVGIREMRFGGVGLDVYEEEGSNVFENREDDIMEHSVTARLLSFPNVIVTSHQGFLTEEALEAISRTTLENASDFRLGHPNPANQVTCALHR